MSQPLTVASFFSGVGLLDLGLEWAGWRTVSVSEVNPYANRILALRYPDAPNLGDLHGITDVPQATLWAGGFPCQPVSVAGKRAAQDDTRWLWPRWSELIGDLRPPYLLLENVSNLLAVNDGRAFGDVLGTLAARGYDAEWDCLPASAVGASHERDRVWVIGTLADPGGIGRRQGSGFFGRLGPARRGPVSDPASHRRPEWRTRRDVGRDAHQAWRAGEPERTYPAPGTMAYSSGERSGEARRLQRGRPLAHAVFAGLEGHERGVVALADCRRHHADPARPGWWSAEPGLGRVAHGVPHRVDRLRCLGNGVVPQVAEFIGWRLREVIEAQGTEVAA